MKTLSFVAVAGALAFAACGNGNNEAKTSDTLSNAQTVITAPDSTIKASVPTVDEKHVDFAVKAANSGLKEIELSQWEQSYGTRADAKDFAAMMITDHKTAAAELEKIAASKSITLPNLVPDSERKDIDNMKEKKSGKEIDKAYVDEMVSDHNKAVKLFEDAAKDLTDPDLKSFASKTLPVLKKHQEHIKAIKAKM